MIDCWAKGLGGCVGPVQPRRILPDDSIKASMKSKSRSAREIEEALTDLRNAIDLCEVHADQSRRQALYFVSVPWELQEFASKYRLMGLLEARMATAGDVR